ncbi:MAG TPA: hypothetical protein VH110_07850 [Candidatus Acidoferrum sp.]|jgi:hypothetical protein|nr:hypothetical protein [Candidatus Acidoferrum sp.]
MRSSVKCIALFVGLLGPAILKAQNTGQVECPRNDGYVYLYSSMTTLDVRTTLQCGEQVEITGRFDTYFGVRTSKGETGVVPLPSIIVLKDKPGPKVSKPAPGPARERIAYDDPNAHPEPTPKAKDSAAGFALLNGTPIRLKLRKSISSASAHVGEQVELDVVEEIAVDGIPVISKDATASGVVTDAEPKKRMGHNGKLGISIRSVLLSSNEKAPVRSYQEGTGSSTAVLPSLASGKDVIFTEGTEFTAYVDGDVHLKREAFQPAKDGSNPAPATPAQKPSQPPSL